MITLTSCYLYAFCVCVFLCRYHLDNISYLSEHIRTSINTVLLLSRYFPVKRVVMTVMAEHITTSIDTVLFTVMVLSSETLYFQWCWDRTGFCGTLTCWHVETHPQRLCPLKMQRCISTLCKSRRVFLERQRSGRVESSSELCEDNVEGVSLGKTSRAIR